MQQKIIRTSTKKIFNGYKKHWPISKRTNNPNNWVAQTEDFTGKVGWWTRVPREHGSGQAVLRMRTLSPKITQLTVPQP